MWWKFTFVPVRTKSKLCFCISLVLTELPYFGQHSPLFFRKCKNCIWLRSKVSYPRSDFFTKNPNIQTSKLLGDCNEKIKYQPTLYFQQTKVSSKWNLLKFRMFEVLEKLCSVDSSPRSGAGCQLINLYFNIFFALNKTILPFRK